MMAAAASGSSVIHDGWTDLTNESPPGGTSRGQAALVNVLFVYVFAVAITGGLLAQAIVAS